MRRAVWALIAASLVLAGCASTPTPKPVARNTTHRPAGRPSRPAAAVKPAPPSPDLGAAAPLALPPPRHGPTTALSKLPGWDQEDHLAALAAFQAGCSAARDTPTRALCGYARTLRVSDDEAAKSFFENNFRAEPVSETPGTPGMLTAYFAPEYEARSAPDAEFSAPVRPRPTRPVEMAATTSPPPPVAVAPAPDLDDLIDVVLAEQQQQDQPAQPAPAPPRYSSRVDLGNADRATIDRSAPDGALAFMRPEDLFFLQIQGSGVLTFPDGKRMKAAYTSDNGRPFVAIARPMVNQGLLGNSGASGDNIRGWLAAHRGAEADKVMWLNPRYVFFTLTRDDDREPAGAAGIPLPAGRAIAIDPSRHAYGEVFWIDAEAPTLAGAAKTYRRVAMALDTGAAIRGQVRADLYIGRGAAAGSEAGRVRHTLRMTRLVPNDPGGSARRETPASTGGG